jgi:hypothetical protein
VTTPFRIWVYETIWLTAFKKAETHNQYGSYYCAGPSKRWPTPWRVYVFKRPVKAKVKKP